MLRSDHVLRPKHVLRFDHVLRSKHVVLGHCQSSWYQRHMGIGQEHDKVKTLLDYQVER